MTKERFKIIPSSYLVLIKDGKVLLSRRYNTGYMDGFYGFPAGHLDGGETFKQAMVREAREEIGITINPLDLELIHVTDRMMIGNERIDLFFTAKTWQGEPKNMEPEKCDDLSWFDLNSPPENVIPYIGQVIESIPKNIIYTEREGEEK